MALMSTPTSTMAPVESALVRPRSGPVISPLVPEAEVSLVQTWSTTWLIARWRERLGIDISSIVGTAQEIGLYQCCASGLRFFVPVAIVGDNRFYGQLSRHDWYYMPWKWEHRMALADLARCGRILEVGCGRGDFIGRISERLGAHVDGLELNEEAVAQARRVGRRVHCEDLADFAAERAGRYDAVCAFEVLEHVPHPRPFLERMLRLLRPGGRLIIAVPNQDSFIRCDEQNLLDMPPHHVTRWNPAVLRYLQRILPVHCRRLCTEPLQPYHVDWYLSTQDRRDRLLPATRFRYLKRRVRRALVMPLLRGSRPWRYFVRGMTVYVSYSYRPG